MKYLLDTCVISDLLEEVRSVVDQFLTKIPDEVAVSVATLMELEYGLALRPALEKEIRPKLDIFFNTLHLLPFYTEEAKNSALIWSDLKKRGQMIGAYDILIAGTAVHHGLILVTSDLSDFRRVKGLNLENWRED